MPELHAGVVPGRLVPVIARPGQPFQREHQLPPPACAPPFAGGSFRCRGSARPGPAASSRSRRAARDHAGEVDGPVAGGRDGWCRVASAAAAGRGTAAAVRDGPLVGR